MSELLAPFHRTQMIDKYHEHLLDLLFLHGECRACKKAIFDSTIRTIAFSGYRSPESFAEHAKNIIKASTKNAKMECDCGRSESPSAASLHAHHSGRGADLVARCNFGLFGVSAPKLLWWTEKTGYQPATLTDEEARRFARDATVRSIAAVRETQGIEAAFPIIEAALAEIPGDAALLLLIPRLLSVGKNSLAGKIVDIHRAKHPEDPAGHAWDGEIAFRLINGQLWGKEHLPEAEASIRRALALKPDHLGALLTMASSARMRDDLPGARALYQRILESHPEADPAHYNLAVMALEEDPARALAHFQAGEKISPEDADYPIGCARALVKLGRRAEAQAALDRGTKLDPEHRRIPEVRAALG